MFQRTTIPDGPRVITARLPGARSVAASVYVLAGSRAETDGDAGAAHFMEHLTFRGTAGYPSSQAISEAVEGIGGVFNAATDRESTVYWAKVPGRETERAVDVLADLIVRPLLRDGDIAGERDIIVEEIRSYRDDPADLVGTLFDLAVFGETPLGREIAGNESSVRSLEAATLHDFWSRTAWSRSPATWTTKPWSTWSAGRSGPAMGSCPGTLPSRPCPPPSGSATWSATPRRHMSASVCPPFGVTTRSPGPSSS
jgi:predicted Zn-dependent peptidase